MRKGYLLVLPLLAVLLVVEGYPLAETIYLSLTDYATGSFVGASNYSAMLSSGYFFQSVAISVFYAVGSTLLALGIGLLLSYELSLLRRGRGVMESVVLAPLAASPILAGILWGPSGVWDDINTFWHYILGQPFFNSAALTFYFPAMVIGDAWEWSPLIVVVALGIMSSVPSEVYEAAEVSGASAWQTFRRISLPVIISSPVMQFVLVIRLVDSLRAFEIPFAWSTWISLPQAGSGLDTVSLLLFKLFAIPDYNFPIGLISATALTLLLLTLAATAVLFSILRRQKL